MPRWAVLLAALPLLLLAPPAAPHVTQLSSSRVQLADRSARAQLELNARDIDAALGTSLAADGQVSPSALAGSAERIAGYVLNRVRIVDTAGAVCGGRVLDVRAKGDHVLVDANWTCPYGSLIYEATLFHEIDPAARHMLTVSGKGRGMALLGVGNARAELHERPALTQVLWRYLLAGVEHIVIGYDHIAFLLAVIAWGRRVWPLVAAVTAFTVAHSITLSLAVLDVVRLPSGLVETLIALSIVYVAAENFFVRDLRRRWWITFAFGLVHGFGFASVLRDYGLPREAVVPALAAFNVGVEIGQVAIVLAALAAISLIERAARTPIPNPRVVYTLSAAVLMLGLYWTSERAIALI